ncbi:MAG: SMP-30/gluconolactonase/LRE family protein [Planctomycetota bacterium]|jgi:hypothetical protein
MRPTCLITAILTLACAAGAGESGQPRRASFAKKPSASKSGAGAKISFAAQAQTDCAVYVLDSTGKVVRHLAAGVLGPKAPPPLKPGLAQELVWDGKDDLGKPAKGGPFKVRVALGLTPTLDRMIGEAPGALAGISGLAVSPSSGELHVFHTYGQLHPADNTAFCAIHDRKGRYLRTIMPWPANLTEEKLKGAKRVDVDGEKLPYIYQGECRSLLPGLANLPTGQPCVAADGKVAFIGHHECGTYNGAGQQQLVYVNADGSPPATGWTGPVLAKSSGGGGCLAFSPDGKTIYASGIAESRGKKPAHCVYKFGWGEKKAEVFVGDPKASGSGADKLSAPRGVAVDGEGSVYVADRGNGRVAAFKADGAFIGEVKIANPDQVQVHPKNGAIYVTAGTPGKRELVKFKSIKDPSPACRTAMPMHKKDRSSMLALDTSAEPPVIWYSHPRNKYTGGFKALRIEDRGNAFGDKEPLAKMIGQSGGVGPVTLTSYNRVSGKLLINKMSYDPATGKLAAGLGNGPSTGSIGDITTKKGMGGAGLDGNVYLMGYSNWMKRLGPDLKPKPFPGGNKGTLASPNGAGTLRVRSRGVTADPAGNVFALWQENKKGPIGPSNYLAKHSPEGKTLAAKLIECQTRFIQSPRLDYQGNIYVAVAGRPAGGKVLPASFDGQDLGKAFVKGQPPVGANWYEMMYGCILKFGPEGGKLMRQGNGGMALEYGRTSRAKYTRKLHVSGAQWAFFGASPVPGWEDGGGRVSCGCESPRFDVDGFGRSFFPDACRFRCGVIDTAGNEICWFGSYGNIDSAGPKSSVPVPEIPMLWPYCLAVSSTHVYVGDRLNRRVVAVKMDYAAEETVALR